MMVQPHKRPGIILASVGGLGGLGDNRPQGNVSNTLTVMY
jgi:hypothetical protein